MLILAARPDHQSCRTPFVRPQMVAQLPADSRGRVAQSVGNLPDAQPPLAQGGDPLPLEQRQVPAGAGRLGQPCRRQATVLCLPPVPGLTTDASRRVLTVTLTCRWRWLTY